MLFESFVDHSTVFPSSSFRRSWLPNPKWLTYDLSVKNPNGGEEVMHRSPKEILKEIARGDAECAEVLEKIRRLL